jgi:hypothetical protein
MVTRESVLENFFLISLHILRHSCVLGICIYTRTYGRSSGQVMITMTLHRSTDRLFIREDMATWPVHGSKAMSFCLFCRREASSSVLRGVDTVCSILTGGHEER